MNIIFLDEAQEEFLGTITEYASAHYGLGERFKHEVERSVLWLAAHPELLRTRKGGYRRMNLRVFPYYIAYIVRHETVWILAVAHGSRRPNYYISRRPPVDPS